jgi:hypothetical protein
MTLKIGVGCRPPQLVEGLLGGPFEQGRKLAGRALGTIATGTHERGRDLAIRRPQEHG